MVGPLVKKNAECELSRRATWTPGGALSAAVDGVVGGHADNVGRKKERKKKERKKGRQATNKQTKNKKMKIRKSFFFLGRSVEEEKRSKETQ